MISWSNSLRPVVSLLALLVVVFLWVCAPGVASAAPARSDAAEVDRARLAIAQVGTGFDLSGEAFTRVSTRLAQVEEQRLVLNAQRVIIEMAVRLAGDDRQALAAVKLLTEQLTEIRRARVRANAAQAKLLADRQYLFVRAAKSRAVRQVILQGLSFRTRQIVFGDQSRRRTGSAHQLGTASRFLRIATQAAPGDLMPAGIVPAIIGSADPQLQPSKIGALASAFALTQVGRPYRWAGMSPATGFDCSGLIAWSFGQAGLALPHQSAEIWALGTRIPLSRARPGDIMSFHGQGHVGIYLGGGNYVHSTQSGDFIRVSSVASRSDLDGVVRIVG